MGVSYPMAYLNLGGAMIPCETATVSRMSKRGSDRFTCTISINRAAQYGYPLAAWADFQPTQAQLMMSSAPGGGDMRSMVTGEIDNPEIDWMTMKVTCAARDLSAKLTEGKRNQKFQNQKSSDIVSSIAQANGLGVAVQSTPDYSGQLYDQDTVHLIPNRSDWETLDRLADREGFRWYVDGQTLYFEPNDQSNGSYAVQYTPPSPGQMASGNLIKLTTGRNMTAAKGHKVTVKSWHGKDKKVYSDTETAPGVGSETVTHEHHHNMRSQQEVTNLAKARLKDAIRHYMQVEIEMPGDLTIDVRQTLSLSGTGTIYDQTYDIDAVEWEMGWASGFEMKITAKSAKAGRSSS